MNDKGEAWIIIHTTHIHKKTPRTRNYFVFFSSHTQSNRLWLIIICHSIISITYRIIIWYVWMQSDFKLTQKATVFDLLCRMRIKLLQNHCPSALFELTLNKLFYFIIFITRILCEIVSLTIEPLWQVLHLVCLIKIAFIELNKVKHCGCCIQNAK